MTPLMEALIHVKTVTGVRWNELARRLSMSARTLARIVNDGVVPSSGQALAMLAALNDLPPAVYTELADALGVDEARRPLLRIAGPAVMTPVNRAAEESAVTLMLYRAAEANGVAPAAARNVALAILDHATARGFDLATARDVTRAATKR